MTWLLFTIFVTVNALPCALRPANTSFICVCNETFCDTISPITGFSTKSIYLYSSSKDGLRFSLHSVKKSSNFSLEEDALILVPQTSTFNQTIFGFGGAFTDSAIDNINSLPSIAQDKLLKSYFLPSELGYTYGRVPLACTDFSSRPYSYDGMPGDFLLNFFSLAKEDTEGKIPMIKRAEKIAGRKIKLVAGAWSAPAWMKVDNKVLSPGNIRVVAYQSFARYHIRFLEEYKKHGITFWAITSGNEPINAVVSTQWLPDSMRLWLSRHFGPALNASFPDVRLILFDDFPNDMPTFFSVLDDPNVRKYVAGWATHPYRLPSDIAPNFAKSLQRFPEKFIIQDEYSVGVAADKAVVLGSWERGEDYAERIIEGFNNGAVGWIDWNLALNPNGGPTFIGNCIDSAIIVNGTEFYKQPSFYVQGHFSHFIKPGARRIAERNILTGKVSSTASLNPDGSVIVVLLNRDSRMYQVNIRTGTSKHGVFNIAARSITSVVYRPDD